MARLDIRVAPDPVLRATCSAIETFDANLATLASDMLDTMYDAPGRGLAAPQIGETLRLFVMDATWKDGVPTPMVFCNPRITRRSDTKSAADEACLSIPGVSTLVMRPEDIDLSWQDLDGQSHQASFSGFEARCIQHEADHLDGVLCTDYPT